MSSGFVFGVFACMSFNLKLLVLFDRVCLYVRFSAFSCLCFAVWIDGIPLDLTCACLTYVLFFIAPVWPILFVGLVN